MTPRGLKITGNSVRGAGNGGILVWRSTPGDDGTLVIDNRIENVANKSGGSGQYGNAINVFRADNVIVRGNRIKQRRVLRRARQHRLQSADRRQYLHRARRGRAVMPSSASKAR